MPHAKLSLELRKRLKPFCLGLSTLSLVLPRPSFHNLQKQCQFMDHCVSSGPGLWLLNILSCSQKVVQPSYCTGCTWYICDIYTFHSPKSLVGRRTSSFTRTRRWFSGRSCALKCCLDHHINGKNREYKAMNMKGATTAQPTNCQETNPPIQQPILNWLKILM